MPEAKSIFPYTYTPDPPKKAPIIKLSCGIGDTDGFPAFDVDSDAYASKEDPKWGFLITGGAEFHMPLTVFQVTSDGLADKGGIRLGDIILEINEEDATHLTLTQAHEKIDASGKKIHFLVKSMDDEDNVDGYEPGEEKSIVLRVPKPMAPPKENAAASIEARLLAMQRKLSEIAEIPKILSSTLAAVAQTFDKLMPSDHEQQQLKHCTNAYGWQQQQPKPKPKQQKTSEQQRKCSYDEDALDYELRDVAASDGAEAGTDASDDGRRAQLPKRPKVKDVTPESDYASEANYGGDADEGDDETEDNDVDLSGDADDDELTGGNACDDDDDDEDDDEDDDAEVVGDISAAYNYRRNYVSKREAANHSRGHNVKADTDIDTDTDTDTDNDDDNDNDDNDGSVSDGTSSAGDVESAAAAERDSDDDDDFLSTTYTWNLRNIPKLRLNDGENVNDIIGSANAVDRRAAAGVCNNADKGVAADNGYADCAAADDDDSFKPQKKLKRRENGVVAIVDAHSADANCSAGDRAPKFMDNLERAWPWADREKIIYKQSTCHLVRRKPLGLVEQRKQLLAKQNLVDTLQRRERQLK